MKCIIAGISFLIILTALSSHAIGPNYRLDDLKLMRSDTLPPMWEARNNSDSGNPFDLQDPTIVEEDIEIDEQSDRYMLTKKIGDEFYTAPVNMSFEEYLQYQQEQADKKFMQRMNGLGDKSGFLDFAAGQVGEYNPMDKIDLEEDLLGGLFGGATIDIKPSGFIDMTFGGWGQVTDNPALPPQSRVIGFRPSFDMNMNMRVEGGIGDKFRLGWDYNTQATFDFDNRIKLAYDSEEWSEDEIIKKVEVGDVSLPLNSQLIQGSQRLFGLKTELQFGKLTLTGIASQQRTRRKEIVIENGAQVREFFKQVEEYDENRHFFLTHYNRNTYNRSLANLPQINTLFKIRKIEVWMTNQNQQETDNLSHILAVADLGESSREYYNGSYTAPLFPPDNPAHPDIFDQNVGLPGFNLRTKEGANPIYPKLREAPEVRNLSQINDYLNSQGFEYGNDYEVFRGRRLREGQDYFVHKELGFVSMNRNLQTDHVLSIAMEYEYNGEIYQVGEFFDDADSVIVTKMIKNQTNNVKQPIWDLMMKNVYSIGAYRVEQQDFQLDVFYDDPGKGEKRFLPETNLAGKPLIQVLNLDNLNPTGDPQPDGRFDFVEGLTILSGTGKIIFPVLEPFGETLRDSIDDPEDKAKYSFRNIYETSIFESMQYAENNRFIIRGQYKSSVSADISLGVFNLPRGSVQVTAGGRVLQENIDYEIDYNIGRIKIINESFLASGAIKISFEDNAAFGFQTKTMLGLRADYVVNKHINVGGTFMHLYERPFTQKVNIGDDPINNRVFGLDFRYEKNAPWLTRMVDAIPGIDTKEESNIKFYTEAAFLRPGHSKAIRQGEDTDGTVYLDDFEGSNNGVPIESFHGNWSLASVPQKSRFQGRPFLPESARNNDPIINVNRALISWYRQLDTGVRTAEDNNNHYTRGIRPDEIFPQRQFDQQQRLTQFLTFDLNYYPNERGPYNFDGKDGTAFSEGINMDGTLAAPETRWGGIMTNNSQPDFERANYETIEFWLMSPYLYDPEGQDGQLVFDLGSVSEDVMKDGRKFAEHGLPSNPEESENLTTTNLSRLSEIEPAINAFENEQEARDQQDVGLDGMSDAMEQAFHEDYINSLTGHLQAPAMQRLRQDPACDNFVSIQDNSNGDGVLNRYKYFSQPDGNSPINMSTGVARVEQFKNTPDQEDLDQDGSLDQLEQYYQYRIPLEPDGNGGLVLNNYIVYEREGEVRDGVTAKWYRVKIPLSDFTDTVGNISNFRNMQFLRMYMHNFDKPTVLRMAEMVYGRNVWRKYSRNLKEGGTIPPGPDNSNFDISAVNIEQHADQEPFNYVIPEGIVREQVQSFSQTLQQNEQSLALDIRDLDKNDAKAIFKELYLDLRRYKRLKMFAHLENKINKDAGEDGDVSLFVRMGSDYENNYYEYEVPLTYSRDNTIPENSKEYIREVWKEENNIDILLSQFIDLKRERNRMGSSLDSIFRMPDPNDPERTISIIGNPNMGYVKGIMIGVRNESGESRSVNVWVNELRVTGLDERGGMAALAQLEANLADFGNISVAGNYSSIGYGGLDQKVDQRSLDNEAQLDASINLQLGNFFKEESGIRIPFYAQYSEQVSTPEFDPYDLDVKLKDKLDDAETDEEKDVIKEQAQERTVLKSYNFTNVRKERTGNKTPMPWDVENLSASYAYSEMDRTTPIIEVENEKSYTGELAYDYGLRPLYIFPFKKLIKKGRYLQIIKDINLNPIPNAYTFNTVVNRKITESRYRFTEPEFSTWYTKRFTWDRNYGLKWDLTQSLKINYNSTAMAVIDEPNGRIDTDFKRDSVINNVQDFGRLKNFTQSVSASYNLPIDKIPALDWVKAKAQYSANYNWSVAALNMDSLGNVISNTQKIQLSADLNFQRFYQKWDYLARIDRGNRGGSRRRNSIGNSATIPGAAGKKESQKKQRDLTTAEKIIIRPLLAIRQGRFNYTENNGTTLPGFLPQSKYLGLNESMNAPGWKFVSGVQPNLDEYLNEVADKGWITDNLFLNTNVLQNKTTNFDASIKVEPFRDFVIDVTANKQESLDHSEKFKVFERGGDWERRVPYDVGSYTISFFTLNTLLGQDVDQLFNTMEDNRVVISNRLGIPGTQHEEDSTYTFGYGAVQQEVLIPAFLAAYTDTDPNSVKLNFFDQIPLPNWNLRYSGLSSIPMFKERVKQFSLNHAYRSTMQVNRYNTESNYAPDGENYNDQTKNYYSRFEVPNITITESLEPLLGISTTLQNDMTFGVEYGKNRTLDLNFISDNKQVIETNGSTFSFTFAYLMKDVNVKFLTKNLKAKDDRKKKRNRDEKEDLFGLDELRDSELQELFNFNVRDDKTGDLQMGLDVSIRDELTKNHLIDKSTDQVTRGARTITLSPNLDYSLNKKINLRVFFQYQSNDPYTTQQFRRVNYNGGVTVRVSLQ